MGHLIILQLTPNQSLTSHHYRRIHINRLDGIKRKPTPSKLSRRLLCLYCLVCLCVRQEVQVSGRGYEVMVVTYLTRPSATDIQKM